MAIEDWIPDFDGIDDDCMSRATNCKHCDEHPLWWEEFHGRIVLVDAEGSPHAPHCSAKIASASEFPTLTEEG